jgi:hypothetical protein
MSSGSDSGSRSTGPATVGEGHAPGVEVVWSGTEKFAVEEAAGRLRDAGLPIPRLPFGVLFTVNRALGPDQERLVRFSPPLSPFPGPGFHTHCLPVYLTIPRTP